MKKKILKKLYKPTALFLLMLMPALAMAQDFEEGDGDGDDVDDEVQPEAPINNYMAFTLIAGCGLGYVVLRRESKVL